MGSRRTMYGKGVGTRHRAEPFAILFHFEFRTFGFERAWRRGWA